MMESDGEMAEHVCEFCGANDFTEPEILFILTSDQDTPTKRVASALCGACGRRVKVEHI